MKPLKALLSEVASCRICEASLPLGANPVLQCSASAKVLIAGQAPGSKVHATGIPFDDPSGDRLRDWMGVSRETFYNADEQVLKGQIYG
jgi:uracil-DNA glycosylase